MISPASQDNSSVRVYSTKLKALWDQVSNYRPLPICPCGSNLSMKVYSNVNINNMSCGSWLARMYLFAIDEVRFINVTYSPIARHFHILQEEQQQGISDLSVSSNSIQLLHC